MDPRDIQAFVQRDWDSVRAAKERYWAERIRKLGPAEGFRIGDELRRQKLALDPDWPSPAEREADLAHHVRLAELFRRVGRLGDC